MPLPATFFDAINIDNTTIDTNSVTRLLDITFDTADTNSSSSVNPMSMEGTLHHRYIATYVEDYVADDEEEDSDDDNDNNRKQRSVIAPLLNMSSEQTMTEETTGAQDFGGEAQPVIFSWFVCWIVAVFCLPAVAKQATNPTPRTHISINLMKKFHCANKKLQKGQQKHNKTENSKFLRLPILTPFSISLLIVGYCGKLLD
ncbi:hypothetical protein ACA910_002538 [Epithemia clementina (nom. ined.)]